MTEKNPEIPPMSSLRSSIIPRLGKTFSSYHQLTFYGLQILYITYIPSNVLFELSFLSPSSAWSRGKGRELSHASQWEASYRWPVARHVVHPFQSLKIATHRHLGRALKMHYLMLSQEVFRHRKSHGIKINLDLLIKN